MRFGNVVHVGERDCSVQKPSHQKLDRRGARAQALRADAAQIARYRARRRRVRCVYQSAGTLEFLVSGDDVYFMEMNTRIQVEHPVTEMLYGVDLVREQIRVAAGERLSLRAETNSSRAAMPIECRINAEEPAQNFAPAAGTLTDVRFPGGCGVRVDSHAYTGLAMPPFYDSLLAKIVAHAATRDRGDRSYGGPRSRDTRIAGVKRRSGSAARSCRIAASARAASRSISCRRSRATSGDGA